ncbi:MAG: potassium-transporting ATPase subunit KdpC [Phycisphaerales bacterium]
MLTHIRPALVVFAALTVITGVAYPLAVTGIGQALFPDKANGSLIKASSGDTVGSSLLGQSFSTPEYFWGRLSGTSPVPYTSFNADKAAGSSGTNLAPTNPALIDNAKARIDALKAADAAVGYARPAGQPIPIDLVTASGSGLDPHISPASAVYQAPRVATARKISLDSVTAAIAANTTPRQLGVLGEPVVHVLNLNRSLDAAVNRVNPAPNVR